MSARCTRCGKKQTIISGQTTYTIWEEMCRRLERINDALVVRNNRLQGDLNRMRDLYEPDSTTEEESRSESGAESEQSDGKEGQGTHSESGGDTGLDG
ncbi:hypothetical protein BD626DRAFT_575662 [Schizophyllum amplum]|uniref:Uncharacterized protein n=1 Tax=Schizophyllum amplum TaxID=97359 RepID=A0A550BVF6_9AGAR|nr:hypothetical protein BD626DRAFT_575662 [Auriculariopsis ampla]